MASHNRQSVAFLLTKRLAIIGARMFLPASRLGLMIDYTPSTFPPSMQEKLQAYGSEIWEFRERTDGHATCRAVQRYKGDQRVSVFSLHETIGAKEEEEARRFSARQYSIRPKV